MIIIHLARKPLSEPSVAANVIRHGVGGLNVDRCRIGNGEILTGGGGKLWSHYRDGTEDRAEPKVNPGLGRWPANLLLSHHPDCIRVGTKRVKGSNQPGRGGKDGESKRGIGFGKSKTKKDACLPFYTDPDSYGTEIVEDWDCTEQCPVRMLDQQSGERSVSGCAKTGRPSLSRNDGRRTVYRFGLGKQGTLHNDSGGASRFFKQIGGTKARGVRPLLSRDKQIQDDSE